MFPLIENCPRSTSASTPAFFDEQLWFREALRDGLLPADSVEKVGFFRMPSVGSEKAPLQRVYVKSQSERLCANSGFQSPTRTFLP